MDARHGRVTIRENGRSGTVHYRGAGGELDFWWEFGGGDTVAILHVGTAGEWAMQHPWALPHRDEILRRVADEVIRQRAPTCVAAVDDEGFMTLRTRGAREDAADASAIGDASSAPAGPAARHMTLSERRGNLAGRLGLAVFAVAGLLALGRSAFTIRTTGSPVGPSLRTGSVVVTLMTRLEPYVPSLNRDHSKDRYSVGLLLHDVERGTRRYVKLASDREGSQTTFARVAAADGGRVWVRTPDVTMLDLATGRRFDEAAIEADPRLRPPGPSNPLASIVGESRPVRDSVRLERGDGGALVLRPTAPHRSGTMVATRVDAAGRVVWTTDTGIQDLYDVLDDATKPAFVGERPRVPDKVSEPILVVLDERDGRATTHSLWMK